MPYKRAGAGVVLSATRYKRAEAILYMSASRGISKLSNLFTVVG